MTVRKLRMDGAASLALCLAAAQLQMCAAAAPLRVFVFAGQRCGRPPPCQCMQSIAELMHVKSEASCSL